MNREYKYAGIFELAFGRYGTGTNSNLMPLLNYDGPKGSVEDGLRRLVSINLDGDKEERVVF